MKNIYNNEPFVRFNPLNDYLFFKVMGEKGDEIQLLGFLNAVLNSSGKKQIESLEIMENKSFLKEIINGKSCVLDVLAVLQDGTKVNIEVQLSDKGNMDRRSLFYWSKVFIKSLKEGENYHELPNVIAINIVDFNFPHGGGIHTCFHLREDLNPSLIFSPALEIHCINMVQWRKLKEKDVQNNPLHRWLVSFDKNSPPDLIEEVVGMDSAIMAANEKMNYVLSDDEESEHYWKRELARMDKRAELKFAHDQGVEQGTIEVARKLKRMGLSIEQIASGTGLSFEEIENLS